MMREVDAARRLMNRSRRFLRLIELKAPLTITEKERDLIDQAIKDWQDAPKLMGEDSVH